MKTMGIMQGWKAVDFRHSSLIPPPSFIIGPHSITSFFIAFGCNLIAVIML